jgi:hypothetical protein
MQAEPTPTAAPATPVAPDPARRPRRLALAVDGPRVPAWAATAIGAVAGLDGVDVVGWVATDRPVRGAGSGPGPLWRLYALADRLVFGRGSPVLRSVPLDRSLSRLTDDRSETAVVAALRRAELDVVVDLRSTGAPALRGVAQDGTWAFRHGRAGRPSGVFAYVPELAADEPWAPTCLVVLGDDPARDRMGYRSISAISPYSLARTRDGALAKAARFPARLLTGAVPVDGLDDALPDRDGGAAAMPAALPVVSRLARRLLTLVASRIVQREAWFVATRRRTDPTELPTDLTGFEPITAPRGHFYADPFVLPTETGARLFVEDWLPGARRGAISLLELDGQGRPMGQATRILDLPHHLSYPFVVRHDGRDVLIPEAGQSGRIERFGIDPATGAWVAQGVLLEGLRATDPTLVEHDGRWWLFAAVPVPGGNPWDELWLWHAPTIDGPWTPHPTNPVVSDARGARPAGRLLVRDGHLIRPAQDGTPVYGRRIVLRRIDELTPTTYRETEIGSIEPAGLPGVDRTHTIDGTDDLLVIDGRRRRWRIIG